MRVRESPRRVRALEHREIVPRAHVMHRRHAVARHESHRGVECVVELGDAQRRNDAVDERLRVVLEDTGRFAVLVAHDRSAVDVGRVARDPRRAQRRAVRQRHVSVEPIDPHRMIGRLSVDPLSARKLAAPQLVIPIAVPNPRTSRTRPSEVARCDA